MTKVNAPSRPLTSHDVLLKIQQIMHKHEVKKPINLDSLALALHIRPQEIVPYIEELEQLGAVKRHMPSTNSRRMTNMGSVTVL